MIKLKSLLTENSSPLIVYHGTDVKFNRFDITKSGVVWFTSNKQKILDGEVGAAGKGYIIIAQITMNNPAGRDEYEKYYLDQLESMGFDGVILPEDDGTDDFDCFVFSTSQIKILKTEKV